MDTCKGKMECHAGMKAGHCEKSEACEGKMECHGEAKCEGKNMIGKCDMSECAKMTKDECAKMCDEKGCSPDEKAACLAHFGPDGKFIASAKECKKEGDCCKKK